MARFSHNMFDRVETRECAGAGLPHNASVRPSVDCRPTDRPTDRPTRPRRSPTQRPGSRALGAWEVTPAAGPGLDGRTHTRTQTQTRARSRACVRPSSLCHAGPRTDLHETVTMQAVYKQRNMCLYPILLRSLEGEAAIKDFPQTYIRL